MGHQVLREAKELMKRGRPWSGGGPQFVGLPAKVLREAQQRQQLRRRLSLDQMSAGSRALASYADLRRDGHNRSRRRTQTAFSTNETESKDGSENVQVNEKKGMSIQEATTTALLPSVEGVPAGTNQVRSGRQDFPCIQPAGSGRGSKMAALQAALNEEAKDTALEKLKEDMHANSSKASLISKVNTCEEFHKSWFGEKVPVYPFTVPGVLAVASMLKAGGYASGANYLSAARVRSRDLGHAEAPLVGHAVRRALASLERGVGQARQTHALPMNRFGELPQGDGTWTAGGPVGAADALTSGCWWLMREIKLAATNVDDVTFYTERKEVEIRLSCSKTDCRAIGVGRVHGCSCVEDEVDVCYCSFHTMVRQRDRLARMFPQFLAVPEGSPFFPSDSGERITKAGFQQTVEMAATFLGLRTKGPRGENLYTGHVCRRTGAESFTAAGIEVSVTQIFGRWGRVTVLRYCQEAPLAASSSIAARTRRPAASGLAVNNEELKALKKEVSRLEGRLAEQDDAARTELLVAIHELKEELRSEGGDSTTAREPLSLSVKVANLDFDRHGKNVGASFKGVIHLTKVYHPDVEPHLWKARCGWRFGRRKATHWRLINPKDDDGSFGICDKCLGAEV